MRTLFVLLALVPAFAQAEVRVEDQVIGCVQEKLNWDGSFECSPYVSGTLTDGRRERLFTAGLMYLPTMDERMEQADAVCRAIGYNTAVANQISPMPSEPPFSVYARLNKDAEIVNMVDRVTNYVSVVVCR